MDLSRIIPDFVKPMLRPPYRIARACFRRVTQRHRSLEDTHAYWRSPTDEGNRPESYLLPHERSRFLSGLVEKYIDRDCRILEIGCNVGRNLAHLHDAGYRNLTGIEISTQALASLRDSHASLASDAMLINLPIEQAVRTVDQPFDLVFTMAVLEHIHQDSEWVFAEMVRITKSYLITIEDEAGYSWRHFPRDYQRVFVPLGMEQIEEINCTDAGLALPEGFRARVFRKPT